MNKYFEPINKLYLLNLLPKRRMKGNRKRHFIKNCCCWAEIDYIVTENIKVDYIKQYWPSCSYQVL